MNDDGARRKILQKHGYAIFSPYFSHESAMLRSTVPTWFPAHFSSEIELAKPLRSL
jgi:hypothetical protein